MLKKLEIGESVATGYRVVLVHALVPEASNIGPCAGCIADSNDGTQDLCMKLRPYAPESDEHFCEGTIFIEDTPEAKAEYAAKRMGV
jgi:hypothetical protein